MVNLTLEDIAKQAGVSRSTVSRVLNHQSNVREEVRQRVMEVVQTTGYAPNAAARTLASQRSYTLGMVLPKGVGTFFSDPYFPRLTQGIAQACNLYNYTMGLFILNSYEDEEKIYPRISRQGLLDGVLVQVGQTGDYLIERLMHTDMPLVSMGRPYCQCNVNFIDVDNYGGSRLAMEHLVKLGRKRIATIAGPQTSMVGMERTRAYIDVLNENGFEIDERMIVFGDFKQSTGYSLVKEILSLKPDAIFAQADSIAYGAMRYMKENGIRIPEDVAVVGFDDLPGLDNSIPEFELTTVHQPVFQFGMSAVELLIDVIEKGSQPERKIIVNTELVIRETCGGKPKSF